MRQWFPQQSLLSCLIRAIFSCSVYSCIQKKSFKLTFKNADLLSDLFCIALIFVQSILSLFLGKQVKSTVGRGELLKYDLCVTELPERCHWIKKKCHGVSLISYLQAAKLQRSHSRVNLCFQGGARPYPMSSLLSNLPKAQQGRLTLLITTAIGLLLRRKKAIQETSSGCGRGPVVVVAGDDVLLDGDAVEGRNVSVEWKMRKHNLSHHSKASSLPVQEERGLTRQGMCVSPAAASF